MLTAPNFGNQDVRKGLLLLSFSENDEVAHHNQALILGFTITKHCLYHKHFVQLHTLVYLGFLKNKIGSGGGTRTPDTRIMIPLL